jgi:hypothetical protein
LYVSIRFLNMFTFIVVFYSKSAGNPFGFLHSCTKIEMSWKSLKIPGRKPNKNKSGVLPIINSTGILIIRTDIPTIAGVVIFT